MKFTWIFQGVLIILLIPVLACGPSIGQVTPTPTKTPRRVRTVAPLDTPVPTAPVIILPSATPTPTETPTPVPPTETPTPVPPTETPTPVPPTNTPVPPPPPTFTPVPVVPTQPPPPPTSPPAPPSSETTVIISLPNGNSYERGESLKIIFTVRDPDGINVFTWGVFTQNLTPLIGGEVICHNAPECSHEVSENAPGISGTFIVGADVVDSTGATKREIGEIYVN